MEYRSQIVEIFPIEDPVIYYQPPTPKISGKKGAGYKDAEGKLYTRYRNELKRLRKIERTLKQHSTDEIDPSSDTEGEPRIQLYNSIYSK